MDADALVNYRSTLSAAIETRDTFAITLAYNNIALVWQHLNRADSARIYLSKAAGFLDDTKLTQSQNLFYQMQLAADLEQLHLLPSYLAQIQSSIGNFLRLRGGWERLSQPEQLQLYKVLGQSEGLCADYCSLQDQVKRFRRSLDYALKSHDAVLILNRQLSLGRYFLAQRKVQLPEQLLDSMKAVANQIHDAATQLDLYKYQQQLAELKGDKALKMDALQNLASLEDSVKSQATDLNLLKARINISSANAKISVENMKRVILKSTETIGQQKAFIYFLMAALFLLSASLVVVMYQRKRKNLSPALRQGQMLKFEVQSVAERANAADKELANRPGMECLEHKLAKLNQREQPFLNPDLNLDELAAMLGTNHTYLSSFINHHFGVNFNDYLNGLRVEHACILLLSKGQQISIDQVYERSGFHSRSTFYAAFKKHTGVTPAAFLKMEQKEQRKAL